MSGQKSILNFLKPVARVKRPLSDDSNVTGCMDLEPLSKKTKSNENKVTSPSRKESTNELIAEKTIVNENKVTSPTTKEDPNEVFAKKTILDENNVTSPAKKENPNELFEKKTILDENNVTSPVRKEWPNEIIAKIIRTSRVCPALHQSIGHSWFRALEPEFKQPYFKKLSQFLVQQRAVKRVFPPEDKVWSWTQLCDISDVKVVILGQDPYHNPGQAHGLCFSVPPGIQPPPSLLNMYQELESDIPGFVRPNHGYLIGWAEQGVLLLNACLTVICNAANSHKDQGWEKLTDAVIRTLSSRNHNLVFLLWGAYAQKKADVVDKKKHHLLKAPHPSPLSAHRGFFGCKHFSQCNQLLQKAGKKPIDWSHLPLPKSN